MNRFWLLFLAVLLPFRLAANDQYYDKQEEIRRAAERLDEMDRRNREAAKERYDRAHPRPSSNDDGTGYLALILVFGVFCFFAWRQIAAQNPSPARRSSYVPPSYSVPTTMPPPLPDYYSPSPKVVREIDDHQANVAGQKFAEVLSRAETEIPELLPQLVAEIKRRWKLSFELEDGKLSIDTIQLKNLAKHWDRIWGFCDRCCQAKHVHERVS